jgi:hypothetical protein|tara:strand:+ start:109 stop:411 length:303 start_codon:yes stop_codon:yes gene_type:complete
MTVSGSNIETAAGALFFNEDGSVELHVREDLNAEDRESIILASDFFQFALEHDDWLAEFIEKVVVDEDTIISSDEKVSNELEKSKLSLIYGGKYDPDQIN